MQVDPYTQNMGSLNEGVTHNLGIRVRMAKRIALGYSWVHKFAKFVFVWGGGLCTQL